MGDFINMKKWKKGSFTVEAAFIVPAAVLMTVLLILCIFYVHNQVWYKTAALEAALAGNSRMEGSGKSPGETALESAKKRAEQQVMPGEIPYPQVNDDGAGIRVSYSGSMFPSFPEGLFSCTADARVERVRPVKFLRMLQMAEKLGQAAEYAVS